MILGRYTLYLAVDIGRIPANVGYPNRSTIERRNIPAKLLSHSSKSAVCPVKSQTISTTEYIDEKVVDALRSVAKQWELLSKRWGLAISLIKEIKDCNLDNHECSLNDAVLLSRRHVRGWCRELVMKSLVDFPEKHSVERKLPRF